MEEFDLNALGKSKTEEIEETKEQKIKRLKADIKRLEDDSEMDSSLRDLRLQVAKNKLEELLGQAE